MKQAAALLFSLLSAFCLTANDTLVFRETIYFQSGKSELDSAEQLKLKAFVDKLYFHGQIAIEVEGHTDNVGSVEKNMKLSEERAKNVEDYLKMLGFDFRVEAEKALGQNAPKASNASKEGQKLNRRVEVKAIVNKLKDVQDFFESVRTRQTQTFVVNCQEPQTIVGKNGIRLGIPANAFVDANGKPVEAEKVEIRLVEATKMSDMLLLGLTTMTSDGNALETGGMFRVEAFQNNEPLSLAAGKTINFSVPTPKALAEMKVYSAAEQGKTASVGDASDATGLASGSPETMSQNDTISTLPKVLTTWNTTPTGEVTSINPQYIQLDSAFKSRLKKLYVNTSPDKQFAFKEPKKPNLMKIPDNPGRPESEDYTFNAKNFKETFYSPKKKKSLANVRYQNDLKSYQRKYLKYQKDSTRFFQNGMQFNKSEGIRYENELLALESSYAEHFFKIVDYQLFRRSPKFVQECNNQIEKLLSLDSIEVSQLNFKEQEQYLNGKIINSIVMDAIQLKLNSTPPKAQEYLEEHYSCRDGFPYLQLVYKTPFDKVNADHKIINQYLLSRTGIDTIMYNFKSLRKSRIVIQRDMSDSQNKRMKYLATQQAFIDAQVKEIEGKSIINAQELSTYVGGVTKLGWVNCDRSIFNGRELSDLRVKCDPDAITLLTFESLRAILPISRDYYGAWGVERVPSARKNSKVVSFKINNGKPQLSVTTYDVVPEKALQLSEYRECNLTEIKALLD